MAVALGLAGDKERLAGLRAGLRRRMNNSNLCQPERLARSLESSYRRLWKAWKDRQTL